MINAIPIYVTEFYDCPLAGLCKYNGETLFFRVKSDPNETPKHLALEYAVYRLPADITGRLLAQKRLFEEHVGTHWTYSEEKPFRHVERTMQATEEHKKFYDTPRLDVRHLTGSAMAQLVGYFTWKLTCPTCTSYDCQCDKNIEDIRWMNDPAIEFADETTFT